MAWCTVKIWDRDGASDDPLCHQYISTGFQPNGPQRASSAAPAPQVAFWSTAASVLIHASPWPGPTLLFFPCCPSPRPLIKPGPSSRGLVLSPGRGGSCSEPITIQNGFSRTEKNSCLYYLNASPFPTPLIGSLITGRGARWLIRNRLLVK